MSNDQPSPYSTAAVEATVDHLRQRIRELEADLSTVRGERNDLRNLNESLRVCAESSTGIAERYTAKYKELHDAARAVVEVFGEDAPERCLECGGVATSWDSWGSSRRCDEHSSAGAKDYPYAEKWRRLCALVKP